MAEQETKKMLVKASEDVYVALTTGDAVRLEAEETRDLPHYIAYACIQAVCTKVREATTQIEALMKQNKEKPHHIPKRNHVQHYYMSATTLDVLMHSSVKHMRRSKT